GVEDIPHGHRVRVTVPVEARQDDRVRVLEEPPLLLGGERDRLASLHDSGPLTTTRLGAASGRPFSIDGARNAVVKRQRNVRPEEGLPMKAQVVLASILASALMFAGAAAATAPPAKGYSSSLTANTDPGSTATAQITKSSKLQIKPATGNVCFTIKLKGVTDLSSTPITNTGNTMTVQVAVNNVTHNK